MCVDVCVGGWMMGEIGVGLFVLVCVECGDIEVVVDKLFVKLFGYCVFSDVVGKMNFLVLNIDGEGCVGGLLFVL